MEKLLPLRKASPEQSDGRGSGMFGVSTTVSHILLVVGANYKCSKSNGGFRHR